ncbi:hypothetical protein COO60DRAFT_486948 [Scenedesmus sp. NREL 46B-D3]|nr:hypothetical protein COO60DRAFT_486948 [Scenedesmus sp. NREL 46B-D3]
MQLAVALPAAAAVSPPPAAAQTTAVRQQQQQQGMRMLNISSISMAISSGSEGMLAALPAHSLTRLDLQGHEGPVDGAAVSAALARLRNLQQLHIAGESWSDPARCLTGVAQLTRLTLLELDGDWTGDGKLMLDLSRLTQLHKFSHRWKQLDAIFPPQLQQLTLDDLLTPGQFEALMPLQQLLRLEFVVCTEAPELLLRLTQLPALQHISLTYDFINPAAAAVTWAQLPQLCELSIDGDLEPCSQQQWQATLDGVAASTHLTKLQLPVNLPVFDGQGDVDVAWCEKLTGLINLRKFCLKSGFYSASHLVRGDALALSALTGLTRLVLEGARQGVGSLAATAIAGSCMQLHHLELRDCNLGSMASLANVRHLTQLTELRLEGNSGLTQQGLMLLTGLKRLQLLGVDTNAEVTDEVV